MAIPNFEEIMLPALRIIGDAGENPIAIKVIFSKLCYDYRLSEEEKRITLRSGDSVMFNRVRWAVGHLYQAGLVVRPQRGFYSISVSGRQLLQNPPKQITSEYLKQYSSFKDYLQRTSNKRTKSETTATEASDALTIDEKIVEATRSKEDDLRDELRDSILKITPLAFEKLIIKLMVKMNYGKDEGSGLHTGKSGDGGVDGIIFLDELHLDRVYLQAKLYNKNTIPVAHIREFAGVLDEKKASKGVFVTTSEFSKSAKEIAERSEKSLELVDGSRLIELLYKFDVGVRVEQTIKLKSIDNEFLEKLEF